MTGIWDDADDVGFFTKHYDDLVKKKTASLNESGVKIQKAEIVEDVADGAGDLGRVVKEGSGAWNNSSFRKNADPFREFMGPGVDSHPEQWNALLKEMKDNGVEIVYE